MHNITNFQFHIQKGIGVGRFLVTFQMAVPNYLVDYCRVCNFI